MIGKNTALNLRKIKKRKDKIMKNLKRNLSSIILAVIMIITSFSAVVCAEAEIGTAKNPYLIGNLEELKAFVTELGKDNTACARLTSDIDLAGENWTPIAPQSGYATDAFAGTFDGDYHTISNLNISSSSSNGVGFFGTVNGATIKNLNIDGTVVGNSSQYVGGIVGRTQGTVIIDSCSFSGSVSSTKTGSNAGVGGIVGRVNAGSVKITNSFNKSTVTGSVSAGILGYLSAKGTSIENCYNSGTISGSARSGGIAGQVHNSTKINLCYNKGKIEGEGTKGNISAFNNRNTTNCYYTDGEDAPGGSAPTDASAITKLTDKSELLSKLGTAFVADEDDENAINGGYPILSWQKNSAPVPKNPRIEIISGNSIVITNNDKNPTATITASFVDADPSEITWSLEEDNGVLELNAPETITENNTTVIAKALKCGKATVVASAQNGEITKSLTICVYPEITTVRINGIVGVGETVKAQIDTIDGEYDYENYPEFTYQWQTGYDTADMKDIQGQTSREFTITDEYLDKYLSFYIWVGSQKMFPNVQSKAASADRVKAEKDNAAINIDTSDIKEAKTLTLPKIGENGSTITWTSSAPEIINPETGEVTLPESGIKEVSLSAVIEYNNEKIKKREIVIKVYSLTAAEEEKNNKKLLLEKEIAKLGDYYTIIPKGENANVLSMLCEDIKAVSTENITAQIKDIKEIHDGADIAPNGDVTYFFKDPNTVPSVKFGAYDVTFTLSLDDAEVDFTVPVRIYWDTEKVKEIMRKEILSKISVPTEPISENLTLPKTVDGKYWTLINWKSNNENALYISNENQSTADTLFDPYVGVVKQGAEVQTVTLTAEYEFRYTGLSEDAIKLYDTFTVTVDKIDEETAKNVEEELSKKLDNGFKTAGLKDYVTGETLTPDENGVYTVSNDIRIPNTKDFGVDGKYEPVSVVSENDEILVSPDVNNAARISVIRPMKDPVKTKFTVSITDNYKNVSASRTFEVLVMPITEDELNAEIALMEKVKASYFDGIKGGNDSKDDITSNLSSFQEVYEKDGSLVWVRKYTDITNRGIVPVNLKGWEQLEAWRLFKSDNPAVISHENLIVKRQANSKQVKITSALSSETLGKYGELYEEDGERYADYKEIHDKLYYQVVEADVIVRGRTVSMGSAPVANEKINVTFRLKGPDGDLISKTKYENLPEKTTAFEVFQKAINENGYKYTGSPSYVTGIITPDGTEISEKDYGKNSGWMYKLNGQFPDDTLSGCGLSDGDDILMFFTKDYTKEDYTSHGKSPSGATTLPTTDNKKDDEKKNDEETKPQKEMKFKDIKDSDWHFTAVKFVFDKNLMNGVSEDDFAPSMSLSRAMAVTILYRLAGEPEVKNTKNIFSDAQEGSWYEKAVLWANENGIVNGMGDGTFMPDLDITREQLAAVMYRYCEFCKYDTKTEKDLSDYKDADRVSDYAVKALSWANENGIVNGSDNLLMPSDNATRAQTAAIIMRFVNVFVK